jgi:hypothetical protein
VEVVELSGVGVGCSSFVQVDVALFLLGIIGAFGCRQCKSITGAFLVNFYEEIYMELLQTVHSQQKI